MDEEDFWKQIEDLLNQALQCEPVNRPRFLASIEHSGLRAEGELTAHGRRQYARVAHREEYSRVRP